MTAIIQVNVIQKLITKLPNTYLYINKKYRAAIS
jgi:hypothetical protein